MFVKCREGDCVNVVKTHNSGVVKGLTLNFYTTRSAKQPVSSTQAPQRMKVLGELLTS